jgi:cytidylate kinase
VTRLLDPEPALGRAIAALRERPRAVVLVDGRSGSGKTTFGAALADRAGAALLRLEDLYPGWDGLAAASASLVRILLTRTAGAVATTWDWDAAAPGGRLRVPVAGPLVVEGCGALSRQAARSADLRIWVELPEPERRARALARDGAAYAPHWERWARQERVFLAQEDPRRLADLLVDGRRLPQPTVSGPTGNVHYPRCS